MNSNKVILNKYNFYELAQKPSKSDLSEYYSKKYYQDNKGSYEVSYTDEELLYFKNKIEQKFWAINNLCGIYGNENKSMLDIGCGEGFTLKFFKDKNWFVKGIDYSDFGCKKFNPDCVNDLLIGDIFEQILPLINDKVKFDVVWLDNVLEHVLDPLHLLNECKKLLNDNGVLIIEVPNDFSILQQQLLDEKKINSEFWVVSPDHISYFNSEGLASIAMDAGLKDCFTMADYPIDFNLTNPDTNYNKDKSKGKNAHWSRIEIDNLMHSISVEKTVSYYKSLADLGLGRQVIMFLKHN